jgi:L-asparaginase II
MSMDSPVLVELTRGALVESVHRGSIAVCLPDGRVVGQCGRIDVPVFPRSAIKLIQALPLVTSGAADHYGFAARHLALACASHSGGGDHVAAAREMLRLAGVPEGALACGAHLPIGEREAHAVLRAHHDPVRCHNNCSGKHAGMLAVAQHLGETLEAYEAPDHPVQRRIKSIIEALCDTRLGPGEMGTDGCSAPNWAVPLAGLAAGFSRLATGAHCGEDRSAAARRLMAACWEAPEFMAGEGRLDTDLLRRFPGELFLKTGAEGVYCGAIVSKGVGFALKIDDGAKRASEVAVKALISVLVAGAGELSEPQPLRNWDGCVVGEIRAAPMLRDVCGALRA